MRTTKQRPTYPPFERTTAGSLAEGDEILIRARTADRVRTVLDHELDPGVYRVELVEAQPYRIHNRTVVQYTLTLEQERLGRAMRFTVTCSAVLRWNRVKR